jgi:arabinan endo-1,5-alpha-L-arabinosidase
MKYGLPALLAMVLMVSTGSAVPAVADQTTHRAAEIIPVSGDIASHDPSLVRVDSDWYVFATGDPAVNGGNISIRRSIDGSPFAFLGTVFPEIPQWVRDAVPGVSNLWAPDVTKHNGVYYLYYAASTFGSNRSLIGLATNTTLDPDDPAYRWVDRGEVFRSVPGNDYNAIDPGVVETGSGKPYLTFGSFWSGIREIPISWPSGKPDDPSVIPLRLVDRHLPPNAVEGAYMIKHGGWYLLFVSFDVCCRGVDSTYKIAVGRSRSVTGPFFDESARPMLDGGGTVLLSSHGNMVGPGGESVFGDVIAFHYYDAARNGAVTLGLRRMGWDNGWPVLATADGQ